MGGMATYRGQAWAVSGRFVMHGYQRGHVPWMGPRRHYLGTCPRVAYSLVAQSAAGRAHAE